MVGPEEMGREHLDVCLPLARYCSTPVTYFLFSLAEPSTPQVQLQNVFRFDRCFRLFVLDEFVCPFCLDVQLETFDARVIKCSLNRIERGSVNAT